MSQCDYDKTNPYHPCVAPELGYIEIMARRGIIQAYTDQNSRMVDKWQHVLDNIRILIAKEYKK